MYLRRRIIGSLFVAVAFGFLAHSLGVPLWTTWKVGDVSDIVLYVFLGVFILTGKDKPVADKAE